jgi:serine phosphatase RsbU (regulator of sigma subunit)
MGFMALRFSGPRSFPEEERRLLVQLARQYSETLERARLFDSERRSRELVTRLQEVTAALSAAATREEVVDAVIDVAIPALDARTGVFGVVEESELAVVRSAGYEAAPFPERLDLDDPWPIADAVRRKTIVELETVADRQAAYGVPDEVWAVSGQGALIAVPLLAGDRAVGAIGFTRDEPGRMTLREAIFVGSLAGQAALALERAGLYETERRARDDLARLQGVTAALSAAADVGQVVEAVLDQALPALQARAGALLLVDEEGGLELVGSRGYEGVEDLPERVPLDSPLAAARAVRGQEIVVIESDEERRSRYELSEAVRRATGDGTLAAVPLVIGGRAIGSFGFSLEEQRSLTDEECAFLLSLGRQAAQAVERARLFEGEQAARREAEEASMTLRALQAIAEIGLTARTIDDLLEPLLVFLRDAVGADRAWLLLRDDRGDLVVRAAVGLDESTGEQAPVPWGEGIAGRIAAGGQPLIVDDVIEAPPVSHVRDAGGSLVGVPLRVGTETIGVLSVGSERKTAFRLRHVSLLEAAAARVALAVERTALFEREHEVAVTLQRSVLPETVPQRPGLAVGVRYVPGASGLEVGGDWYDAIELDSGELGLVVGDVVGKGVVAAATMAQLRNALRVYALEGLKPASVVARLNRLVETTGPSFATLVYATLDPERRVLRYASAGHPPPVLVRSSGEAVLLEGGRSVPLGVLEDPTFRQEALALEPGDTLVLYTDGLVERREASLEESLQELLELAASPAEDVEELLDRLLESLAGDEPADDVAMLAVSLTAERQRRLELRVPSRPQSLVEIRHQLQAWLVQAGADEGERHEILLACSEACANAIEHAQQPTRDEIEVSAELADGEVLVGVRDFGRWLDPPAHGDRGVGLRLVREMMDSVDIVRGDEGTEVRLRRRLLSPVPVS